MLLVIAKKLFLSSLQHLPELEIVHDYEVNIGGIRGDIFVLVKRASASSDAVAVAGTDRHPRA